MATLNSRGHEVVSSEPFEPSVNLGREPRLTIAEQIRMMVRREKMAQDDLIKDDADLYEDQYDFGSPEPFDGLLGPSPYELAPDVPDTVTADDYRAAQAEAAKPATPPADAVTPADE